jgi:excisionase family DNA binding protein
VRPLLTVPEVAEDLRVSVKTVRRRIEAGELPAVRIGSGTRAPVRVDAAELGEWLRDWLAWPGIVIGLFLIVGSLEFVGRFEEQGWKLAGAIVPIAYRLVAMADPHRA